MLNYNYLGSHDLQPGERREVVFESVSHEKVHNPRNNEDEEKVVAKIKGDKPMIMNSTNLKAMEIVTGSPYVEEWAGCTAVVYVEQVRAFGGIHDALRIDTSKRSPVGNKAKKAELEMLTEKSKKWDQVTGWLKVQQDFDKAMTTLSGKYKVSPGIKKKLKELFEGK